MKCVCGFDSNKSKKVDPIFHRTNLFIGVRPEVVKAGEKMEQNQPVMVCPKCGTLKVIL
jgi:hypothetical protein